MQTYYESEFIRATDQRNPLDLFTRFELSNTRHNLENMTMMGITCHEKTLYAIVDTEDTRIANAIISVNLESGQVTRLPDKSEGIKKFHILAHDTGLYVMETCANHKTEIIRRIRYSNPEDQTVVFTKVTTPTTFTIVDQDLVVPHMKKNKMIVRNMDTNQVKKMKLNKLIHNDFLLPTDMCRVPKERAVIVGTQSSGAYKLDIDKGVLLWRYNRQQITANVCCDEEGRMIAIAHHREHRFANVHIFRNISGQYN